jgi:chemotaxis signal transduction protein
LVVDRVIEVFSLNEADARPVPDLGYGREHHGITAAYAYGGRLVFTLDVESVTQTNDSPLGIEALPVEAEGT